MEIFPIFFSSPLSSLKFGRQNFFNMCNELIKIEGLADKIIGTSLFNNSLFSRMGRHNNDTDILQIIIRSHFPAEIYPVSIRKHHVENNEVGLCAVQIVVKFPGGGGRGNIVTCLYKYVFNDETDIIIIFYYMYKFIHSWRMAVLKKTTNQSRKGFK